jgi:hypothetical protein
MMQKLHSYHLDDDPQLRSCNLQLRARPSNVPTVGVSVDVPLDSPILQDFYGRGVRPKVRYVIENERVDYGKAHESEYRLELLNGGEHDD